MSKLLIDEQPLQVLPSLAREIGLNEAIFLQQLHYWLRSSKLEFDGSKWIYNTFEEWHDQFPFWSLRTIQRIVDNLRDLKLIRAEQIKKSEWDSRNYYTIDYDNPTLRSRQVDATDKDNLSLSDTPEMAPPVTPDCREHIKVSETTQETTSERNKPRARAKGAVEIYQEVYGEQVHIPGQTQIEAEKIADLGLWRKVVGDCFASRNPVYNVGKALHFYRQRLETGTERAARGPRAGPRQSNVERSMDAVNNFIAKERANVR